MLGRLGDLDLSEIAHKLQGMRFQVIEQSGYGHGNESHGDVDLTELPTVDDASFSRYLGIAREPKKWQFLIPASDAIRCVDEIWRQYQTEFAFVRDRLPMRASVLFADQNLPIRSLLDASSRLSSGIWRTEQWWTVESTRITEDGVRVVRFASGEEWSYRKAPEAPGEDIYYSYLTRRKSSQETTVDQTLPWLVARGNQVRVRPSTFAFEYLQGSGERFEIQHDAEGKRMGTHRRELPMSMEEFTWIQSSWSVLQRENTTTQLESLYLFLRQKEEDWGWSDMAGNRSEWHECCKVAVRSLQWRRHPEKAEWELIEKVIHRDLLLILLELYVKILRESGLAKVREQEETNALV
jgi:hypothetical protein